MTWWQRWRADLARGEAPTRRQELPFLAASALVIAGVAQWSDPGTGPELLALIVVVVAFVVRGLVSRLPSEVFALFVVVPLGLAVVPGGHLEVALFLSVLMVLYVAWHAGSTTRVMTVTGVSAALPFFGSVVLNTDMAWVPWVAANIFTSVLGRNLRRQRLLIEELEAARETLADAAVAAERQRIARELHDVAGHTLAAVMLHVTGARHVLRRNLDEAEQALLDAEAVGRASLDQIRSAVSALRSTERGTDPALAGSADLGQLVEEYRRAGLAVDLRVAEEVASVEGPVGTALHRIAREALANVARHAAANRVELIVAMADSVDDGGVGHRGPAVRLVVADHGRSPASAPARKECFGLIGMRERARGLGGDLIAGPQPDGWRVQATLPLGPVTLGPVTLGPVTP